jgi:two-component system, chemotaxis family, sensor kinase CheA
MEIQTDENLQLYVEESLEHLADIESDLLAIELAGADIDEELVNKVFRAAHSIKGGAGFMGLNNIKELSHRMETLLNMIRGREMVPTPENTNVLLLAADALRNLLCDAGNSDTTDIAGHLEALTAMAEGSMTPEEKESTETRVDVYFPEGRAIFNVEAYDINRARNEGKYIYLVEFDLIHDVHQKGKTPLSLLNEMIKGGVIIDCKVDVASAGSLEDKEISKRLPFLVLFGSVLDPGMISALMEVNEDSIFELHPDMTVRPINEAPADNTPPVAETDAAEASPAVASAPVVEEVLPAKNITPGESRVVSKKDKDVKNTGSADTSLRVNVSLLDSLMNLAGELVLGRNQLLQAIASRDSRTTDAAGQRLDLITTELQEAIMLTRMQPIGSVFGKFPRVVRDLVQKMGKQVDLVLEGKEVELDKTIIEAINDPLTHLVRNSVDHGIEAPEDRRKQGKPPAGKVILRAYHEAGQVNIEIIDDGKGIDGNRVANSAINKGLLTQERAELMSDKEKIGLIFLPGLSTAEKVTDVSGRGVGMDVVKTNLDKLGGVVDIDSDEGKGTTIRIKLPLTLAIIPSQIVTIGKERFAIPQVNMDELLRIPAAQVKERIEKVGDAEVVRLRGQLLPLLSLSDVLGITKAFIDPEDGSEKPERRKGVADRRSRKSPAFKGDDYQEPDEDADDNRRTGSDRRYRSESSVNIVVVSAGVLKYGLVVDRLHDSEEIVVKPLGRHLMHCKGLAGATIMGDGRVALILDVMGLSHMAELTSVEGTDRAAEVAKAAWKTKGDTQSLLIFRNAVDEQFAVPLGLVQRIEKIKRSQIEEVGGKRVIQYRGGTLPLSAIEEVAQVKPLADQEDIIVIVFLVSNREAGLLATGPVDAMEVPVAFDETTLRQKGIMGSAIIAEQTTLLVDIYDVMKTLYPHWFTERQTAQGTASSAHTILYAEDSNFFRDQVRGFMESEGYDVIEAENGRIAWDLLQQHAEKITLVVTDLEMPEMDGYGLAENIKRDDRYAHLPIIALTTLAGEEDMARGKSVGMTDYQIKLDRERLMNSIHNHLKAA